MSKTGEPHPAHITAKHKRAVKFNVITHSKKFFGEETLELKENPNKNPKKKRDERKSRVSVPHWENEKSFSEDRLENWHFVKEDRIAMKKWNKKKDRSKK